MKRILYLTVAALLVLGSGCSKKSDDTTPQPEPALTADQRNAILRVALENRFAVKLNDVPTYEAFDGTAAEKNFSDQDLTFFRDNYANYTQVTSGGKPVDNYYSPNQVVNGKYYCYLQFAIGGKYYAKKETLLKNVPYPQKADDYTENGQFSFTKKQ